MKGNIKADRRTERIAFDAQPADFITATPSGEIT